ncbi:MAG TPA: hypothetical protein VII14_11260 [Xanthobacteraceae bacterium]
MLANIGRSQAEQPVTYFGYGGAWKAAITQAFFDPFTRKTGIPVQYQEPYIFAKLRSIWSDLPAWKSTSPRALA